MQHCRVAHHDIPRNLQRRIPGPSGLFAGGVKRRYTEPMRAPRVALVAVLQVLCGPGRARADQVVQLPVDSVLTGRAVSTLSGGAVVPWTSGVDRNDGLMTAAAVAHLGQTGVALPDDGAFPADARHPEIVLHFSNAAPPTSPQTAAINDVGNLDVAIPPSFYSKLFLVLTDAANGAPPTGSPVMLTMTYADNATTMVSLTWPDYGTGAPPPADPPGLFNLISGMHKWNKADMSVDAPTHALTGLELKADASRRLIGLRVSKLDAGKVLVFWGLTGVAISAVDAGGEAGVADAGGADAGGAMDGPRDGGDDVTPPDEGAARSDGGTAGSGTPDANAGDGPAGAGPPLHGSNS